MSSRRSFLKKASLLSSGLVAGPVATKLTATPKAFVPDGSPVVLSTWIHGIEANAEAWKILGEGGAID